MSCSTGYDYLLLGAAFTVLNATGRAGVGQWLCMVPECWKAAFAVGRVM
jgi:hypothetical protein